MQKSEYGSIAVIYILPIIVQVHSYHITWYNISRIWDYQEAKKHDMQYKKTEKYSRIVRGVSRANQKKNWEERAMVTSTNPRFRCALWSVTIRPPRSRLLDLDMRVQGYQKATQRVRKIKPVGMLKQSYMYMIKWCDLGTQVHAMTNRL